MQRLVGKVAIVTGAGRGIGRAIAERFTEEGALVALAGRDAGSLQEAARTLGPRTLVVPTDVAEPAACAALIDRTLAHFGRLDILVNNAGITGTHAPCWTLPPADVEEAMRVNFLAAYSCLHAAAPHLIAQRSGVVLTIGSIASKRPTVNRIAYAASKMALVGLTRTAALELAPYLVRCNLISPGPVAGERLEEVTSKVSEAHGIGLEDARNMIMNLSPMGEPAEASEVAALACYLSSDEARHLTGEDINLASGIAAY